MSSFGTKKGYPVIARCANLPVELRNGIGLGGGRVVGWLPIVFFAAHYMLLVLMTLQVGEDAAESGKPAYANFKRVVWHNSFHELLASIRTLSKIGYKIKCADGEVRHIFPAILILSADYEEQYD